MHANRFVGKHAEKKKPLFAKCNALKKNTVHTNLFKILFMCGKAKYEFLFVGFWHRRTVFAFEIWETMHFIGNAASLQII